MWAIFKRLLLGIILIVLASAVLLLSDLKRRDTAPEDQEKKSAAVGKKWKILLTALVESPVVEEAMGGIMAGFKQSGLVEGRDFVIIYRNAQGDMATLNSILDNASSDKADMIFTMTSPALQTAVNKVKAKPIIFCLAVNPSYWGGAKSDVVHPSNMTGVYVNSPYQKMMEVIREIFPKAKKIGSLFSPAEVNSAYIKSEFARYVKENGLEPVFAPTNSTVEVPEAAATLIEQGIDVFCQIGDNTSSSAFPSIVRVTDQAKVPLFSFSSSQIRQGGLVAVANDHFDSGREAGLKAVQVIRGKPPGEIPLHPARTVRVVVNLDSAKKNGFTLPKSLIESADEVIGGESKSRALSKVWNIQLIEYTNILDVEESEKGIRDGLKESGLVERRDYTLTVRNAQGSMPTLTTLVDAAITDRADLLMTMSTPTLQAAIHRAGNRPIVFTLIASAIAAGAGKTNEDHLPNVTGVVTTSAYEELVGTLRECMPKAKRIGTLFTPSEVNSVYNMERTKEAAAKMGMELVTVPADTSADVPDASLSLMSQHIDAVCQIAGNLTAASFPSLANAARSARLPVFAFQSNQAYGGASVVVARDYYDGGREAAHIAVRIIKGENPARIPFQPLRTTRFLVNLKAAENVGLKIPDSILKRAIKIK